MTIERLPDERCYVCGRRTRYRERTRVVSLSDIREADAAFFMRAACPQHGGRERLDHPGRARAD